MDDPEARHGAPDALGPTAAAVDLRSVGAQFGDHVVLRSTDLTIQQGSFCTLLGPSGAGKTTLLKIVAGLTEPSQGRVLIGGRDVTDLRVQERSVGFVFQHYALFPHLTVYGNIEFPLRIRKLDRAERHRRVSSVLKLVEMDGLGHRYPTQLSGGQQQRVAVARALVYEPDVLLLDEPLGALDRRLRQQLGVELRRIQQQAGITAIYVTHDQEEAYLLSDKIAVMNDGRILQEGPPADLYASPCDRFVAEFLGDTTIIRGSAEGGEEHEALVRVGDVTLRCRCNHSPKLGETVTISIRPEDLRIAPLNAHLSAGEVAIGTATADSISYLGGRFRITADAGGCVYRAETGRSDWLPEEGCPVLVVCADGAPFIIEESAEVIPDSA